MPELPDITVYVEALEARIVGQPLAEATIGTPFLLRTVEPGLSDLAGKKVESIHRIGKRIALSFEGDLHAVLHLMIAGRLHWLKKDQRVSRTKNMLAVLQFPNGTLTLTEAGSKKRASLHIVCGTDALDRVILARRRRAAGGIARGIHAPAAARESHDQAYAHGPPALQRHRQRVLGRDPASRAHVAGEAHVAPDRRRNRARP